MFKKGVAALKDAGIESPALDAAVLMGHVTGIPAAAVLMDRSAILMPSQRDLYFTLIRKRCERVAVSRLVGEREFFSRSFHITDDVLDPRPETEILVEEAIRSLDMVKGDPAVLDIGTGSGAIAVTLAAQLPRVRVTATDISMAALAVARFNASRHCVRERITFVQTDLLKGIRGQGKFQIILSNPPYISREKFKDLPDEVRNGDPKVALVPGPKGTEYYPHLVENAMSLLDGNGSLMVEIGAGQGNVVAEMFDQAGFGDVKIISDLAGTGRVVKGNKINA